MLQLLWIILLLLFAGPCWKEAASQEDSSYSTSYGHLPEEDDDLPRVVLPLNYKLHLHPNPNDGTFQGEIEITLGCLETTDMFVLHAHRDLDVILADTTIHSVGEWKRTDIDQMSLEIEHHYVNISKVRRYLYMDWYEVILNEELLEGMTYVLKLKFSSNLIIGETGPFYLINYNEHETEEPRWFIATDFKSHNSRRVFPCFDEPNYKATFQLSIYRPESFKAFSTTACESTEIVDGTEWEIDHFNITPPMAAESLGIIIFDLSSWSAVSPVQMWKSATVHGYCRHHLVNLFESDMMYQIIRMLQITEFYINTPFPLPNIYLMAVPVDKKTRVSDYWGLVIFSEDELKSGMVNYHIIQAIATQWVGHLVTPYSKSIMGFSNGLAQYLSHVGLTNIKTNPQYENLISWDPSFSNQVYYLYSKLHGRDDQQFTEIRTARLCKILNFTLTEATFKRGFHNFIQDRAFQTFTESQFFKILDQQAWLDASLPLSMSTYNIAKSWIEKDHFPVVTVKRNYINNTATIEQNAFIREWPYQTSDTIESLWWIPILYLSRHNLDMDYVLNLTWLREDRQISIVNLPDHETFIILNPEDIGLFLVNYDHTNWELLSQYLDTSSLHADKPLIPLHTRCKLLSDAMILALSGELDFATALDMTLFVRHEKGMAVWDTMLDLYDIMYEELSHGTHDTAVLDKFGAYVAYLLTPAYELLHEDTSDDKGKKNMFQKLYSFLCHVGYKPTLQEARSYFDTEMIVYNSSEIMKSEFLSRRLCSTFYWYDEEWDIGLECVLNSTDHVQQRFLISLLVSCTRNSIKLERIYGTILLGDIPELYEDDIKTILHSITSYSAFIRFILLHWEQIYERFGADTELWNTILQTATQNFKTNYGFNMVSELYHNHKADLGSGRRIVEQSLYTISEKMNGQYKFIPHIESWLNRHLPLLYTQNAPSSEFMSTHLMY